MKTQHTPGPWKVNDNHSIIPDNKPAFPGVLDSKGEYVAELFGTSEQVKANAQLIASAPELLEALKKIVEDYEPGEIYLSTSIDTAKLAISKAEGKL